VFILKEKSFLTKSTMRIYIDLPNEARTVIALFNVVACAVSISVRIYHQKKQKTEVPKISAMGLSCIFVAFLCSCSFMNFASNFFFGDDSWCALSLKLNTGTYSLHRVLLYLFIIFRLEVLNQSNVISSRIIRAVKNLIGMFGISMVVVTILSTHGIWDPQLGCKFEMNLAILISLFLIDATICFGGTWMFVRPLRLIVRNIERESVRHMLKRTTTWSLVSLISTLVAMLALVLTTGFGGIVGVDCSVTSFSLVMMMSPVKRQLRPKKHRDTRQKASVEVELVTSIVQEKPFGNEPSSEVLDKHFQKVLNKNRIQEV